MSKWTLPAFIKHFNALREDDQRAVEVLAENFEKRMANTNEWRGAIEDQQKGLAPRDETERRLKALEEWRITISSKQIGSSQLYGAAAAIVVVLAAIMGVVFLVLNYGGH